MLTKQELFEQLWPNQFVGDAALSRCITAARQAIGDPGGRRAMIKTLYGRGYRFMPEVAEHDLPAPNQCLSPLASEPTNLALYRLAKARKRVMVLACGGCDHHPSVGRFLTFYHK